MPIRYLLLIFLAVFCVVSCKNKNEPEKAPSPAFIRMEAEGGTEEVELDHDGWQIAGVVNQNGNQRMFGDIYASDGRIVRTNTLLELDDPGRLDSKGPDRGYSIVLERNLVRVTLSENGADEEFRFTIMLEREGETREIVVEQKVSEGYSFLRIGYSLEEDDGDSVFVRHGTRYEFNLTSYRQVDVNPYNGIDIIRTSYFESGQPDAFFPVKNDSLRVAVPQQVHDGEITLSALPHLYGAITREPFNPGITESIDVPAGGARFSTEIEWHRRRLSYTLTLTNNRTGQLKEITGKWVEESPTGRYWIREETGE
jgi:hypothetical protein